MRYLATLFLLVFLLNGAAFAAPKVSGGPGSLVAGFSAYRDDFENGQIDGQWSLFGGGAPGSGAFEQNGVLVLDSGESQSDVQFQAALQDTMFLDQSFRIETSMAHLEQPLPFWPKVV